MTVEKPTQKAYLGTFATSVFIQGCTVLQGALLARLLGPAGRGEFATVILWPNIFAGIGILGINMSIARFAAQGRSVDGLVKTSIQAALITGSLTALACGLALPYLIPVEKHSLLPVAYLFLSFIPLNHLAANLQGVDHGIGSFAWLNATRAILYPVFFAGVALCWWFAEYKIFWVAIALLVANGAVVLMRLAVKRKSFTSTAKSLSSKSLIKESLPFVGASCISIFYMQMDKALLVWLLTPAEIGWYAAAFSAAGSVNVLNSALGIVQFSSAAQGKPGYGFSEVAKVLRRGGILSICAGGTLAVLLPWLLPLVYGNGFSPAIKISYILLPGLIFAGLGEIVNQALRGQGQPVSGVISKVFGLVVMGIVGACLAEYWGASGIACGYLAGELVAFGGLMGVAVNYYSDAKLHELCPNRTDLFFLKVKLLRYRGDL